MGLRYILSMCGAAFCKCGPPLFFMVSGALILHKKNLSDGFSAPYFTDFNRNGDPKHPDRGTDPRFGFLSQNIFSGLNWYLYAYIGYLLMLPFLRILVNHMTRKDMRLFFILTAIAYSVSGILIPFRGVEEAFTGFLPIFSSPFGSSCWNLAFPVLAYCLVSFSKHEENPVRKSGCF